MPGARQITKPGRRSGEKKTDQSLQQEVDSLRKQLRQSEMDRTAKANWPLAATRWTKKRGLIETVIAQSKAVCNLEHTRHRSATITFVNIHASMIAYYERKPVARVDLSDRPRMAGESQWALAA